MHDSRLRSIAARARRGGAALLLLVLPALLPAQASGTVEGTVRSATRQPIADAMVVLKGTTRGAISDANGVFRIPGVPAGTYTIAAHRLGFASSTREVVVSAGAASRVEIEMTEEAAVMAPTVVSATREIQRRADASATIDALSGADIRDARAAHPAGVMKRVPGVHISQLSGEGHGTAIRQPITTKPLYLFLEDGIPTRSTGFFNHNALYEVNIPQSGGLEVLKGPGTALYGSDAIGGVVNVLTRAAPATPTLEAALEGGSFGYRRLLATGGFMAGAHGVRADLNVTDSDGWRDASGYERQSATIRWDASAPAGLTVRTVVAGARIDQSELAALDSARFERRPEINLSPIAFREVRALRVSTAIEKDAGSSLWSVTPYARHNVLGLMPHWQLSFDPQTYETRNQSYGLLAKYRRDFEPMRARVIVGADVDVSPGSFTADRIAPARAGAENAFASYTTLDRIYDYDVTYRQASPYLHAELSPVSRVRIDAGLRYDASSYDYDTRLEALQTGRWRRPADTSVSYRRVSPKVGITIDGPRGVNLYASYREGFRAPSHGQLFQQNGNASTVGLEPVAATSAEVGVRGQIGARVLYQVAAYDMRLHDDILGVLDADGNRAVSNAGQTRHRGLEAALGLALTSRLRLDAAYASSVQRYDDWTLVVANQNRSYAGKTIEAAPRTLSNVLLTWSPALLGGGRLAAEWSSTGRYYMDPENTREYEGFDLLTLHANYVIGGVGELFVRAVNVTDERYAELAVFNAAQGAQYTPGTPRSVFAGLRYTWQR